MPKIGPLAPEKVQRTILSKLGRKVDKVRQVATNLGARPYRVFLVWTKSGGDERGEGTVKEVRRIEVLPTPLVGPLDALSKNPFHAGVYPVGTVRVSEISTSFTEDQLNGLALPTPGEEDVADPYNFFYELVPDGRAGGEVRPQKYRGLSAPFLDAQNVQWVVALERVSGDEPARDPSDD